MKQTKMVLMTLALLAISVFVCADNTPFNQQLSNEDYLNGDFRTETVLAFKDKDFEGTMIQFPMGRYADLDDMNWDHSIESMQVPSDVRVILFEDKNFQGQSLILENDTPNLGELNFKKRAESMIIEPRY
jgi:hypothetical protein